MSNPKISFEDILSSLIAMPTITDDHAQNQTGLDYIASFLEQRKLEVQHYQYDGFPSLVATTQKDNLHPTVMLVAHLDVVPAPAEQFVLSKKDGNYYGRGVFDMKFALATYLWLVDQLGPQVTDYNFGIMVTCDEEVGGLHGVNKLLNEAHYRADVAVIPDGGENWRIETFAKGTQWIKLEAHGTHAHASRPWEGDDAVRKLLAAIHDLEMLIPKPVKREDTLFTIGTIEGGKAANQIPAYANAMLDVRIGTVEDYATMFDRIKATCDVHDVRATLVVTAPPCVNSLQNPFIKHFTDSMTTVLGQSYPDSFSYAATDGRFFTELDIPCVIVEPPGSGRHSADEHISIQGCEQFCTILQRYVQTVAAHVQS